MTQCHSLLHLLETLHKTVLTHKSPETLTEFYFTSQSYHTHTYIYIYIYIFFFFFFPPKEKIECGIYYLLDIKKKNGTGVHGFFFKEHIRKPS